MKIITVKKETAETATGTAKDEHGLQRNDEYSVRTVVSVVDAGGERSFRDVSSLEDAVKFPL